MNCPHGKTRNCEICETKIDRDLNEQIVRENDIRVESCDSEILDTTPISASDMKASSLNQEDLTMTGSVIEKSTIEKTGAGTHRDSSMVVLGRHTYFANEEIRASILTEA